MIIKLLTVTRSAIVAALLFAGVATLSAADPQPNDITDVFLITGEDNALGHAHVGWVADTRIKWNRAESPADDPHARVFAWTGRQWTVATPGKPPFNRGAQNAAFIMCKVLAEQNPEKVYGFVVAGGKNQSIMKWDKRKNGRYYDRSVLLSTAALKALPEVATLSGILFCQGTTDAQNKNYPGQSRDHAAALQRVIAQFQKESVWNAETIFIAAEIITPAADGIHHRAVNAGIARLSRDDSEQTRSISMKKWFKSPQMGDDTYLNSAGVRQLGAAFAAAYDGAIEAAGVASAKPGE